MSDCVPHIRALIDTQDQGVRPALATIIEILREIHEAVTAEGPSDLADAVRAMEAAINRNNDEVARLVRLLERTNVHG
jgi:hypothetical protein